MRITKTKMTSTFTEHTARWEAAADGNGAWVVDWLPGRRLLTMGQAMAAMLLAEEVGAGLTPGDRITPTVAGWAAELGLSPDTAVRAAFEARPRRGGAR